MPLISRYQQDLEKGLLKPDTPQKEALHTLNILLKKLKNMEKPEKGIFMFGPVGRGKSMLMNMFFNAAPEPKRRVHFHAFMEELHERMHTLTVTKGKDPIQQVAEDLQTEAALLCFDEFYITNIADAMLLGRLFQKMFEAHITICATSNWAPEDLFQGGINRDRFMPFIRLIESRLDVIDLEHGQDWRLTKSTNMPHYFLSHRNFDFSEIFQKIKDDSSPQKIAGIMRELNPIQHKGKTIWLHFDAACGQSIGREHYLTLCKHFDTILLEGIPPLPENTADAALRLITLVDILYENKKRFICSAAKPPQKLCPEGIAAAPFLRTVSRLMEMQSW